MNVVSGLSIGGLVLAFVCAVFLTILALYIAWIVPLRIVSLLRDILAESREQTTLLRRALSLQKEHASRAEVAEIAEQARQNATREPAAIRIPGIN